MHLKSLHFIVNLCACGLGGGFASYYRPAVPRLSKHGQSFQSEFLILQLIPEHG